MSTGDVVDSGPIVAPSASAGSLFGPGEIEM